METHEKLKILKETDPVAYRKLRDKINERNRKYEKKRKLSEEQLEAKRANSRNYYFEVRKPYLEQLKEKDPQKYQEILRRQKFVQMMYRERLAEENPDKLKKIKMRKAELYHKKKYSEERDVNKPSQEKRNLTPEQMEIKRMLKNKNNIPVVSAKSYDKILDMDVHEDFIKKLVAKTRTVLYVLEAKKDIERALNAYNY